MTEQVLTPSSVVQLLIRHELGRKLVTDRRDHAHAGQKSMW